MEFLIVLLIAYTFWLIGSKKKLKKNLSGRIEELESLLNNLNRKITELQDLNAKLAKYQTILDIEKKSNEIIDKAINESNLLKARYEFILSVASIEANKIIGDAKLFKTKTNEEINNLKIKYENILSDATVEASKIIDSAKKRAEEIAGDAYKALNNVEDLKNTAQAMKNIIEGYGNEYILPSYNLLDELADDFGYTEAGEELRKAREKTRLMIKSGTAAKCDYVEPNRKETAINFVIDAFNGKVDSILATIRHDNYGKLEQKIKDSFSVVNNLGKSFRNAVITEEYLNSRLDELKFGVIVNELKLKEKEEQRLIKEQIREEERARREYEKAIKEAAKEEELLKKLMEKAQQQLAEASEQQKSKYEQKLNELQEKLKSAEEKNQRALSMAQQTKSGHVYVISNIGSFGEDVYKIGMTRRLEPNDRVKELGDASVPFSFDVHAMIFSEDAPRLERELHKVFIKNQLNKVNPRKEFFKVKLSQVKEIIEKQGIKTKWTMLSDAKEYRESLAIETELNNNSLNQEKWIKSQLINEEFDQEEKNIPYLT